MLTLVCNCFKCNNYEKRSGCCSISMIKQCSNSLLNCTGFVSVQEACQFQKSIKER